MSTVSSPETHEPRRGREARRSARAQRGVASIPYITRAIPLTEMLSEEGLAIIERNAETLLQEVGIEFRDVSAGARRSSRTPAATSRASACAFPAASRAASARRRRAQYVQHARNPERNVVIGGKATVFAPNYGSPFVHDLDKGRRYGTIEDFQQFREARLSLAVHPSFRRHGLRAGRSARQQAAFRDGLCAYEIFGQAVHGLGDQARARRGHGAHVRDPVRRGVRAGQHGLHQPHQRQFAAGLGLDDARRGGGLRAQQPGLHHHAVHPVGRDEPGHRRRHADAGARRGDGGNRVLPAHAPRRAGDVRHLRLDALDAVGRADLRHAGGGARDLRRGAARAAHEHAVPHRRLALRLEGSGRAGGLRERADADADDARRHQFRAARRGLARRRPLRQLREIRDGLRPARRDARARQGHRPHRERPGDGGVPPGRAGRPFPRLRRIPRPISKSAFYRSNIADNNSVEQWQEEGSKDAATRANALWKKMLAEYEPPPLDPRRTRRCAPSSISARRRCRMRLIEASRYGRASLLPRAGEG